MEQVYDWLKTIVIFMIFLTIISNLLGKSDFKKYINVVTGLLLILVTVNPILQFIKADQKFDYYFDSVTYDLETKEIGNQMKDAEEAQRRVILKRYKEEIKKQIEILLRKEELYLLDANIEIEEDMNREEYARIQELDVTATFYANEVQVTQNEKQILIPKITIGDDRKEERKAENQDTYLSPMEIHIRDILSDFYKVPIGNINISIQGGKYE